MFKQNFGSKILPNYWIKLENFKPKKFLIALLNESVILTGKYMYVIISINKYNYKKI